MINRVPNSVRLKEEPRRVVQENGGSTGTSDAAEDEARVIRHTAEIMDWAGTGDEESEPGLSTDTESEGEENETDWQESSKIVAGNIHKPEVREFWLDTLKADKHTMKVLEEGYRLPFKDGCQPQKYREKNNKSALQRIDFAVAELSLIHI